MNNVCFVSSEYPPNITGGLGVHVAELTSALSGFIDVDIILPYQHYGYRSIDAPTTRVNLHQTNIPVSYTDIPSAIKFSRSAVEIISKMKYKPQLLHCHDWTTVLTGIYCKYQFNIPMVFHLHLPNLNPLCAALENMGLICSDLVTVSSIPIMNEIKNRNFALNNIKVINNGVNKKKFLPCSDWPDDDNYILFVGRLVRQKGIEYLLKAFSYIIGTKDFANVNLKIIGDGHEKDYLKILADSLLIPQDKIEFAGWQEASEIIKYYQKAKLVVVPSIYEPFGIVALEAMACKRPVISSKTGGLAYTIRHMESGYLVEPGDILGLSQYIISLLYDKNLQKTMGENSYKIATDKIYQWDYIAKQFIQYYEAIKTSPIVKTKNADFFAQRENIFKIYKQVTNDDFSLRELKYLLRDNQKIDLNEI